MTVIIDRTDVPAVSAEDMLAALRLLISEGKGLALFNGLGDGEFRTIEDALWRSFGGSDTARVAVALRLRALVAVFGAKRLRDVLLQQGLRAMRAAFMAAADERLNARFGFSAQRFVMILSTATVPAGRLIEQPIQRDVALAA